jgi:5-hydroxyisourate hydrolase
MSVSTHVLDSVTGLPAIGLAVRLERLVGDEWQRVASDATSEDGRIGSLGEVSVGRYRIRFDTGAYFRARGAETFYPQVTVDFDVTDAGQHHHVPLLLSPFAYTTYRGS